MGWFLLLLFAYYGNKDQKIGFQTNIFSLKSDQIISTECVIDTEVQNDAILYMYVLIFIRHKYIVHRITILFKWSNNIIFAYINSQPTLAYLSESLLSGLHDLN